MGKGMLVFIILVFAVGWFIYDRYGEEVTHEFVDDVQAYQERSLLPEDN